jgi:hypothetical protein
MRLFVLALLLPATLPAHAQPLAARDDALTPGRGTLSMGVFNPARYALTDNVELQVHPLVFLIAPHTEVHVRLLRLAGWQFTGTYGLAVPALAMRLLQGYLFPSYERSNASLGFSLVPSMGLLASHGTRTGHVFTIKADIALGLPLIAGEARPLEAPAPLEMLFAPVLNDYRARVGVLYDRRLSDPWRARLYSDAFAHGLDDDHDRGGALAPFTFRAGGGLDVAVGSSGRLALGLVVWNSFQHAVDADGHPQRSTDLLPTLDLIWTR